MRLFFIFNFFILLNFNFFNFAFADNLPFKINYFKTPEGLSVEFVHEDQQPILIMELGFYAGSAYDGAQYGLAELVAKSIGQETSLKTGDQLALDFDNSGAELSANVDRDMAMLIMHTQTQPDLLQAGVSTLITAVTDLASSDKVLEQVKQNQIQRIEIGQAHPLQIAEDALMADLFAGTPYEHSVHGTADSLNNINPNDISNFYRQYYVDQNGVMVMVGDISLAQAQEIAHGFSQALPEGQKAVPIAPNNFANMPAPLNTTIHIDYPSKQAVIIMGQRALSKTSPQNLALLTASSILGGASMGSVLYQKLKEQQFLADNTSADLNTWAGSGVLSLLAETSPQNMQAVESIMNQSIADLAQNGPSQIDLEQAQNYLTGSFQLSFSSDQELADVLITLLAYGLPENYLDNRAQNLLLLTPSDISGALAQLQQNNNPWVTVTVGGEA